MGDNAGAPRKRSRWVKVLLAVCVPILAVIGLWIWSYVSACREYGAEVAALREAGEPLRMTDLAGETVPDADNAVVLYRQAVAIDPFAGGKTPEEMERLAWLGKLLGYLPNNPQLQARRSSELGEIVSLSAERNALCRQARGRRGTDWKLDLSGPVISMRLPNLGRYMGLARSLAVASSAAHRAGRDGEAVECLRDTLAMGRSIDEMPMFLVSHLVAMGIDSIGIMETECTAPDLKIGPEAPAASAAAVRALIADLLDESPAAGGLERAFRGERVFQVDTFERVLSGEMSLASFGPSRGGQIGLSALSRSLFRPALVRDGAYALRYANGYVTAARQPSYPKAQAAAPPQPQFRSAMDKVRHPYSSLVLPSLGRAFYLHFRILAWRRMAATALAIRLYQADHGKRPAKLADLVPKYLPAVPVDPVAADGRAIAYLPAAARPMLYSVGSNGSDDGGKFDADGDGFIDTDPGPPDIVFFLDGPRPRKSEPPPPAPGEEPEMPGNDGIGPVPSLPIPGKQEE